MMRSSSMPQSFETSTEINPIPITSSPPWKTATGTTPGPSDPPNDLQLLLRVFDTRTDVLLVLNSQRQIVFANRRVAAMLHIHPTQLTGQSIQQAFGCGSEDGADRHGVLCTAIHNVMTGVAHEESVRVERHDDGVPLDLRITAAPLEVDCAAYTVVSIENVSDAIQHRSLQRIFLHDMLNLAGVLLGYSEMLLEDVSDNDDAHMPQMLLNTSKRLVNEIHAHRALLAAESGELQVHTGQVKSLDLLRRVIESYDGHAVGRRRQLVIDPAAENVLLESDRHLLERVLGNMIKNALEASEPGQAVTVSCGADEAEAYFTVHNEGVIPPEAQAHIFTLAFSTKGSRRGIGTYSMKLLTEHFLHGRISFQSDEAQGTVFCARYPFQFPLPLRQGGA